MAPADILKLRQQGAQAAYAKMVTSLIDYSPCGKLTVDDVLFIARVAQTHAFDASADLAERVAS